jgi:hypothetical protein
MLDDPLFPLLLILRYMHILGAIMLMGGTIFMRCALAPIVAGLAPDAKATLHEQVRGRWARFVMIASGLLLVSGIANLGLASRYQFEPVFGLSYNMVVGIKFLLALPIFLIASFLAGRSAAAKKFQANGLTWMNVNLTLALVMVLMGGALKFVQRQPKPPKSEADQAVVAPFDAIASQMLPFARGGE